jgi:hypothetical protein
VAVLLAPDLRLGGRVHQLRAHDEQVSQLHPPAHHHRAHFQPAPDGEREDGERVYGSLRRGGGLLQPAGTRAGSEFKP